MTEVILKHNWMLADVTEEQINAVRAFFVHNNWDITDNIVLDNNKNRCFELNNSNESFNPDQEPHIGPIADEDECPHCLSQPCVISERNRQSLWPKNAEPSKANNSSMRKKVI